MDDRTSEQQVRGKPQDSDLAVVFRLLWAGKYIIIGSAFLFAVAGVILSLSMPNEYRSEAVFRPTMSQDESGSPALLARVGALAGLNLAGNASSNADLSIEMLKSRAFLVDFIRRHDLVVPLMAAKRWDPETEELILDTSLYNAESKKWMREVKPPFSPEPNSDEIFLRFMDMLEIERDPSSGFLRVSIRFYSPALAEQWLKMLIADLNERIRTRDSLTHERSIKYLSERLRENDIPALDDELSKLLQAEIRDHMLTRVRDEYALETVAAAYRPILKSGPHRSLICVVALCFGGLLGTVAVFVLNAIRPSWFR